MSVAGDSADELVKIVLENTEFILSVSGKGALHFISYMHGRHIDKAGNVVTKESGRENQKKMLKSGQDLGIITLDAEDMPTFVKEAKSYGILYNVISKKKQGKLTGKVDIMTRKMDDEKINQLIQRFNLKSNRIGEIKQIASTETKEKDNFEILSEDDYKKVQKRYKENGIELPNYEDLVHKKEKNLNLNDKAQDNKQKSQDEKSNDSVNDNEFPSRNDNGFQTEKKKEYQSENFLKTTDGIDKSNEQRISIRNELEKLRKEQNAKRDNQKIKSKIKQKESKKIER